MGRKIGVLLLGALAGLLIGPVFFNETGPGFELAQVVGIVLGAFVAVVIYEIAERRTR